MATGRMIEQILQRRFSDVPADLSERLHRCTVTQLNTLVNPALDVGTWEEFAVHLPASPDETAA